MVPAHIPCAQGLPAAATLTFDPIIAATDRRWHRPAKHQMNTRAAVRCRRLMPTKAPSP